MSEELKAVLDAVEEITNKVVELQRRQQDVEKSIEAVAQQFLAHLGRFPDPSDLTADGADGDEAEVLANGNHMLTLELVQWVDHYLIPTFALDSELNRWVEDVGVISELRAAYVGYGQVISAVDATFDPMDWHSRLASCIDRIRELRNRRVRQVRATNL